MDRFLAYVELGLSSGLVYGLLALGLVLVYKGSRVLNFAHPYLGLLTAFNVWWLTYKASFPPFQWLPFGLGSVPRFVMAVVLSLAFTAFNGYGIERNLIRRLRGAPRLVLLVLTIALAQGVVGTVALVFNRTDVQTTTARSLPSLSGFSFTIGTRVVRTSSASAISSG